MPHHEQPQALALCLVIGALTLLLAGCGSGDPATRSRAPPPLISAAERGDLSALDALLGKAGAPDVRDACRWTPLMKAALNGHLALVDRLLAAGADPQAEDKGGYTAVMLAASNNHAEVVELLLQRGAKADQRGAAPRAGRP